jgi:protein-S-isoprenylcysteine O-methyltransferase Ste14
MDPSPRESVEAAHQDHGSSTTMPEVANLGIVRPPLVYLTTIITGSVLEFAWPTAFLPRVFATSLGIALLVAAVMLFFYSIGRFRTAGTPVPGNRPTTAIVRAGPYRFSRNPIYVAFSLLQLGVAISINSLWLIATLIVAIALMAWVVIPREERYLEEQIRHRVLGLQSPCAPLDLGRLPQVERWRHQRRSSRAVSLGRRSPTFDLT